MAYRILAGERPEAALRRIAAEQIDSAIEDIEGGDVDLHTTVHEVRKRCKKTRGLIRLFRPAFPSYSDENAALRDAARLLSELRDAAALVETCDALAERFAEDLQDNPLAGFRETLVKRRDAFTDSLDAGDRLARVREALAEARERGGAWSLEAGGFDAIAGGFQKVHRRARRGLRRARREPSAPNLHEWRKRVKYHRYHLRLLRESWPSVLRPLRDSARLLSDRLGDDHDLAVLRQVVVEEEERFDPAGRERVLGLIGARRTELQAWSFPEARRLLGDKSGRATQRMRRLWEAWCAEQEIAAALPDGSDAVS